MKLKLFFVFSFIQLALARYAFVPKFYGQDSAVIVDTDKQLPPTPYGTQNGRHYYHRFPMYQIIQPLKSMPTTTTTTSTTSRPPAIVNDEFPRDLLEIAQSKLGFKRLDKIPSIRELGDLLGTDTDDETISYIRQLAASDQGVALMKSYFEIDDDAEDDDVAAEEKVDVAAATADLTVVETDKAVAADADANATKAGFFQRMASYLNIYNLLPQKQTIRSTTTPQPQTKPVQMLNNQRPFFIRNPLPYHYPIPLRPTIPNNSLSSPVNMTTIRVNQTASSPKPLINTPKVLVPPHIQQISKFTNIPPKQLESFLERKPKLAELAKLINNVALANSGNNAVNSQLMNAVKNALEQDDDIRRLLSETNTLK